MAIGGDYNEQSGIWFYDLNTKVVTGIPTEGNVSRLFWRPDGNAIAAVVGANDGALRIYDVLTGTILIEVPAGIDNNQILWSGDGTQFVSLANEVSLHDASTGERLRNFRLPETSVGYITGIAWSEEYQRVFATIDVETDLIVWNSLTGEILTSHKLPFVSWGPALNGVQDKIAIGSNEGDGRVQILDARSGSVLQDFSAEGGGHIIFTPVWSPDDTKLAFVTSRIEGSLIWIVDAAAGHFLQSIPVNEFTSSTAIEWSYDGNSIMFSDGYSFPTIVPLTFAATPSS